VARYAALLRGVNVAGNKLAMAELVRIVESSGGRRVRTYLQSGNVVFDGAKRLATELERSLLDELGVHSRVLVRSAAELARVVEAKPFAADGKAVSVTFLASTPSAAAVRSIDPSAYADDRFAVIGAEVYLHTPSGYGRSKLNNTFWERRLSTVATTRNWNTVVVLAEMTARAGSRCSRAAATGALRPASDAPARSARRPSGRSPVRVEATPSCSPAYR
jgi:uncharacterized protein (DUF1697 family)